MKVIIIFCLVYVGLSWPAYTQNRSVFFESGTFEQALQKAKKENKLVFLDTYTAWCSACKWMDKTTFKQDEVADFFNSNFINFKIDTEQGEGPEIKKRYPGIVSYPTYFILDTEGNELHRIQGGGLPDMFITKVKAGINPGTRLPNLARRYETENHSRESFIDYLKGLELAGQYANAKKVAGDYIQGLGEHAADSCNWFLYCEYFQYDPFCKGFELLLKQKSGFIKNNGADEVNKKINTALLSRAQDILIREVNNDPESWEKLHTMVINQKPADSKLILIYLELVKAKSEDSFNRVIQIVEQDLAPSSVDAHKKLNIIEYFTPVVQKYGSAKEKQSWEKALNTIIKSLSEEKEKESLQNLLQKWQDSAKME